ncbi:hypothetical protein COB11_07215 [Candidatus Aerophobetes bacterium]|uniref:Uncharacterized protein n=1 Tax=Aerophobetes bacterium TaxID=2030807 RepID=A0A2A4YCI4_UNCAE|nr:MAG: hypothetical protein COB11_07380 [Candidatus Aerophobetes bacterium]PCI92493.1 MAG: hypothetical protein COB11_07215 [Candidatus Aerophobetes bacterium]
MGGLIFGSIMTDYQWRLWQSMIDLIQRYLNEETNDFYDLVGKLEEALDAADIKDKELVSKWYDFWTPLKTRRAVQGNNIDKEKAVSAMYKRPVFSNVQWS